MGGIKEWEFDNKNQVVVVTDEAGFETNFTYDNLGNLLSKVDNQGTITSYIYAHKSFLEKVIEDVGGINRTTEYSRDEYGRILETKDASGVIYKNVYDAAYRVIQHIEDVGGKNIVSTKSFDSLGRIIKKIDSGSNETAFQYDQAYRLTKEIHPDGGESSFIYDNMFHVINVIRKVNSNTNYIVAYEYNKIYQVTKMIEDVGGLNIITKNQYDGLHRLAIVTDANNQTTTYEYDLENRLTKKVFADGGILLKTHDLDGRITSKTDQGNDVCFYSYDSRDLLTQQTYGNSGIKNFAYDSLGLKISDSDNNSGQLLVTTSYTFDKLYRELTSTQKIGSGIPLTDSKVYNAFGEMTQHTLASGKVINYTYTVLHQLDKIITDVGNGIETIANYDYNYDTVNSDMRPLVKKKTLASGTGIHTNFEYDALSRQVLNESKNSANTTVVGFEYGYNLIGNRLTDNHLHKSDESETYSFDTAQRFTNYQRGVIGGSPVFAQGYTLDALANWTSFNNNGTTQNRTHDATNAITSLDSQTINNDSKGNQLNKDGKNYYWDKLNRLTEIRNSSNQLIGAYFYNADNLRVQKTTSSGTEQYYYSGARVCVETNGSQSVTKEYVHGDQYIDEIITVIIGGTPYFYLYDLRFNMYAMVDNLTNIVERARYQGYGKQELMDASFNLISTPLVDQPYSYTGQRIDEESGLQYYRARYFDNDLGRFINRDPLGYIDGMNLYRGYFTPLTFDSSGLADLKVPGTDLKVEVEQHPIKPGGELGPKHFHVKNKDGTRIAVEGRNEQPSHEDGKGKNTPLKDSKELNSKEKKACRKTANDWWDNEDKKANDKKAKDNKPVNEGETKESKDEDVKTKATEPEMSAEAEAAKNAAAAEVARKVADAAEKAKKAAEALKNAKPIRWDLFWRIPLRLIQLPIIIINPELYMTPKTRPCGDNNMA